MAPYPEPISRATDRSSSPSIGTHGRSLKIEHPKVMLSPGQRARTAGHLRPNSNSVPDRIVKWSSSRGHVSLHSFTSQAQGALPHVGTLWLRATTGSVDPFDWLSRFLRVNSYPGLSRSRRPE